MSFLRFFKTNVFKSTQPKVLEVTSSQPTQQTTKMAAQAPAFTPLKDIRLLTTAHDASGKSYIAEDDVVQRFLPFGPQGSGFYTFHSTQSVPVAQGPGVAPTVHPKEKSLPRNPPNGTTFCVTDISPGGQTPMHRTVSVDYIVVLSGEIVMHLDDGTSSIVKQGDCIVQQGTMHKWENKGKEVCRMLVVMVGAEKVVVDGKALE